MDYLAIFLNYYLHYNYQDKCLYHMKYIFKFYLQQTRVLQVRKKLKRVDLDLALIKIKKTKFLDLRI